MPMATKEEQREYQRLWIAARRRSFFSGKVCVTCGSSENLELDHIDRKLKVSHNIWSWKEERRLAEIAKCQTLCYNCHVEKTALENSRPITHGLSGYDRFCRCQVCKKAQSERLRSYRFKLKCGQAQGESPAFQAA